MLETFIGQALQLFNEKSGLGRESNWAMIAEIARGIDFWGEAFQIISLVYSTSCLGNAIAPTSYFEGRSWPKSIKSLESSPPLPHFPNAQCPMPNSQFPILKTTILIRFGQIASYIGDFFNQSLALGFVHCHERLR